MNITALWLALQAKGVPPLLQNLISVLHEGISARVRVSSRLSCNRIRRTSGCVLAPALFNLAMNFIMEPASRKVGNFSGQYQDYRSRLRWRRCVVYRYIWTHRSVEDDGRREESAKFGLRVSWAKTKIQNLGAGPDAGNITVNHQVASGVRDFTCQCQCRFI